MEVKTAMGLIRRAVAIDDSSSNNIGVIGVYTANRDGFTVKINIPVALTAVYAGLYHNNVFVGGGVYCRLNVVKIRRPIVVNGD